MAFNIPDYSNKAEKLTCHCRTRITLHSLCLFSHRHRFRLLSRYRPHNSHRRNYSRLLIKASCWQISLLSRDFKALPHRLQVRKHRSFYRTRIKARTISSTTRTGLNSLTGKERMQWKRPGRGLQVHQALQWLKQGLWSLP